MIFSPELAEKVLDGSKTVTRRPVKYGGARGHRYSLPCRYRMGRDYAVQPGRGKKSIGRIRVIAVDPERFFPILITPDEAEREGFDSCTAFVGAWVGLHSNDHAVDVYRIEFELAEQGEG